MLQHRPNARKKREGIMARQLFINLPVEDLDRTKAFYAALGFSFNPQFSNEKAACMIISDTNYAMLLSKAFFATFTPKPIADAHACTEALIALSLESREAVDAMLAAALAHGGREPRPMQDLGFMMSRAFEDPDGHIWEPFYMDPGAVEG
jgi:uncharacterized protein